MIGHSRLSQNNRSWGFIFKADSLGEIEWMNNFGDTSVYSGTHSEPNRGDNVGYLLVLDENGDSLRSRS